MNINQLNYFIAVAEHHSFTKAANQYYVSQTAITQQIHALEEQMNVTLFDRTCRPIELTPAGKVFLIEAKAIVDRMNIALGRVHDASTGLVGSLRIGYTKGYERSNLSNILKDFHHDYPNILATCYRCDTESILMMIAAEEGISIMPSYVTDKLADADNLSFVPLIGEGEYEQIIAVWRKHDKTPALSYFIERI